MNSKIAFENFELLAQLPANQRLVVDKESGKLAPEQRWISSFRRSLSGDSRKDLLEPIRSTFKGVKGKVEPYVLEKCIKHAQQTFAEIYPDFEELVNLFEKISKSAFVLEWSGQNMKTEELSGIQIPVDVHKTYKCSISVKNISKTKPKAKGWVGFVCLDKNKNPIPCVRDQRYGSVVPFENYDQQTSTIILAQPFVGWNDSHEANRNLGIYIHDDEQKIPHHLTIPFQYLVGKNEIKLDTNGAKAFEIMITQGLIKPGVTKIGNHIRGPRNTNCLLSGNWIPSSKYTAFSQNIQGTTTWNDMKRRFKFAKGTCFIEPVIQVEEGGKWRWKDFGFAPVTKE